LIPLANVGENNAPGGITNQGLQRDTHKLDRARHQVKEWSQRKSRRSSIELNKEYMRDQGKGRTKAMGVKKRRKERRERNDFFSLLTVRIRKKA